MDKVLGQLEEEQKTFIDPSEENKVYIAKLKQKVSDLEDNI